MVDNASRDGSADAVERLHPDVTLIRSARNLGFGAANNLGLQAMTGHYALLLNSDAAPATHESIDLLADILDARPEVVATGGRLLNPDGTTQESVAGRLTLGAVASEQLLLEKLGIGVYWRTRRLPTDRPSEVDQLMGACLMFRPVERFDERFFLYCEDTELCRRLARHGTLVYEPRATFVHELGASSAGTRWQSVARYNRGKELYFAIHHGPLASATAWVLNRLGALVRLIGWSVVSVGTAGRSRAQVGLWWRVLTSPRGGPPLPPDSQG